MARLFEPTQIQNLGLPNRFVRSATWEGLASEDGACTPELVKLMVELARGGAGLIITGHTYVSPIGQATPWQLGISNDDRIEGLHAMTETVHREGGRIIMQLAHGGLRADPTLTGMSPLGPSRGEDLLETPGQEMTVDDIQEMVEAFGQAARRAKEAGFDGLQIHAAHGYLLSQFLSPAFNQRKDNYGGGLENRTRVLLEVIHSVRGAVGPSYPALIKINSEDFLDGGFSLEESVQVGVLLDRAGVDAIEVSGGTAMSGKSLPFRKDITYERDQAYFRKAARALKAKINAPVILVGGIRSYLLAERLVIEGVTDYVSMSRPFIREPRLIERWRSGDIRKATCISCNSCFGPARSGRGIYCVEERKIRGKRGYLSLGGRD